jgi:hypothetical protein
MTLLWMMPLGCLPAPTYVYGQDLDQLELVLLSETAGIAPDTSVLDDPNNPFADGFDAEMRWTLTSDEQFIAGFYAWATTNASGPHGEAQFYTGLMLHRVYDYQLSEPDDRYLVWTLAVGAYQAVLDQYPDDLTYDATGTVGYRLVPLAYQGIVDLGGVPEGNWVQVTNADGGTDVVPGS